MNELENSFLHYIWSFFIQPGFCGTLIATSTGGIVGAFSAYLLQIKNESQKILVSKYNLAINAQFVLITQYGRLGVLWEDYLSKYKETREMMPEYFGELFGEEVKPQEMIEFKKDTELLESIQTTNYKFNNIKNLLRERNKLIRENDPVNFDRMKDITDSLFEFVPNFFLYAEDVIEKTGLFIDTTFNKKKWYDFVVFGNKKKYEYFVIKKKVR